MATIYKRRSKSGVVSYYGDITYNHKRYRRYLGLSKKVAEDALKRFEYELTVANTEKSEIICWKYAQRQFEIHLELTGITDAQRKYVSSRISAFKTFFFSMGKVDILREVTAQDCRDYLKERSREPLRNKYGYGDEDRWSPPSVSTLNREIGFQRRFFRFCLQQGWIDRNPWDGVPSIRDKTNGKPRYNFTETDLKRIFSIAGKFADLYYFMLHTGVRPTDAFTVRSRAFKGHSMTLQMNKTGDWLRSIPVADHVIKRISNRIAMRGLLFPELKSDRQRRNARKLVQSLFTPNFVREKIITLHTFRHTYAQNMLNKGMPKEVLQTFLGHRSIRTTEIYANWLPSGELEKWIK